MFDRAGIQAPIQRQVVAAEHREPSVALQHEQVGCVQLADVVLAEEGVHLGVGEVRPPQRFGDQPAVIDEDHRGPVQHTLDLDRADAQPADQAVHRGQGDDRGGPVDGSADVAVRPTTEPSATATNADISASVRRSLARTPAAAEP